MIALRLELLTGRYVASEFNNRNRAEWPPHPARVFSALVAAFNEGGRPAGGDDALRWLERLPPPQLTFSAASTRDLKIHYVPVNDKAITDVAQVSNAWAEVLAATDDKQGKKAEQRLTQAYGRVAARAPKLGSTSSQTADHLLPATRTKQPRTFPTVIPEDPVIYLVWEEDPSPEVRAGLDGLASALVRVGHSSSLVTAVWTETAPLPTWTPDPTGPEVLRWVMPGQLAALDALHDGAPFAEQRVMPYSVARYKPARPMVESWSTCFSHEFIVLRRVDGPRLPITATDSIADAVRRALMSHASEPTPTLISGHAATGGPLQHDHLAIVPLAYVGGAHASGDVVGVALVPPAGLSKPELQPLYAAIAQWEAATQAQTEEPRVVLTLGSLGRWELERVVGLPLLHNLRESTWTHASRSWASVTPVVLDRYTRSADDVVGKGNQAVIAAACERIGLPAPIEVELSFAPFFRGSQQSHKFKRRQGTTDRRPLVHARLEFEHPVVGPVLIGAGRYRGLGLFRPWGDSDD